MGNKYIKKDENGKEYLYEDLGIGGLLFGDRKIGEVKDSGLFSSSDATVKSDDFLSSESYSIDRDKNPVGGLWGAPEYLDTKVTDERTQETSDYDYDWRVDGVRYSERQKAEIDSGGDISESAHEQQAGFVEDIQTGGTYDDTVDSRYLAGGVAVSNGVAALGELASGAGNRTSAASYVVGSSRTNSSKGFLWPFILIVLLMLDIVIPDPIPFLDEAILFFAVIKFITSKTRLPA